MTISTRLPGLNPTLAAVSLALCGAALAQEGGGITPLRTSESAISIGIGVAGGDDRSRARFGMYNGLRKHDNNLLFGFTYQNRDGDAGRWLTLEGNNIGLDNREFGLSYRRLGDLKLNLDYGELVRHDPRTINTSMQGAGTTTPAITLLATPSRGSDVNLEIKRKALGLLVEKQFGNFQLEVNFKNEDKSGARLWGRGFACSASWSAAAIAACTGTTAGAVLLLPEPIDSTIRQLDARLNYSGEKLKLSGGYYGSFYTNDNGNLTPRITFPLGNMNGGALARDALFEAGMQTPMALWPDNQAHQLFVGGNYKLTSYTKLTFKYAYTRATQNESFTGMGLTGAPGGRGDLGGRIDTQRGQIGFSTKPMQKAHLHGDLVYESKSNKTPVDRYNVFYFSDTLGTVRSGSFTNNNQSPKKWDAKLEGNYQLPYHLLAVLGVNYEREDYGAFTQSEVAGGVSGLKQKLATAGFRAELRKTMSETFTGSVSFKHDRREGKSPWLRPIQLPGSGVLESSEACQSTAQTNTATTATLNACVFSRTAIFPFIYENREREKMRFLGNWTPTERLSLQAFLDKGRDKYRGPTFSGLQNTHADNLSVDASYTISDNWNATAYYSRGKQQIVAGHSTGYDATLSDNTIATGVGVNGTPWARFKLGANVTWIDDKLTYLQALDRFNTNATNTAVVNGGGLPDVTYRLTRLNLFGEYALQKNSNVRLDYIHHRTFFNEWTYNYRGIPFLFSDNTILTASEKQHVNFIGASYVYKFQ